MEKHRITALPVVDAAGRAGRRAQRARPAARRRRCEATRRAASMPALRRASRCWCSTSTACSPTGASTTARGRSAEGFHVRDGHGIKQRRGGRHHGRHHLRAASRRRSRGARASSASATCSRAPTTSSRRFDKLARSARRSSSKHCACVGDDTPDVPILAAAGLGIAVADAHPDALAAARHGHHAARRPRRGARGLRLADRRARKSRMKSWTRPLGYAGRASRSIAGAYYLGRAGRGDNDDGRGGRAAARPRLRRADAEVIETGYDGRERFRLNARVIRQQTESSVIDLEGSTWTTTPARRTHRRRTPRARRQRDLASRRPIADRCAPTATTSSCTATCASPGSAPGTGEPLIADHRDAALQHAHGIHRDRRAGDARLVGRTNSTRVGMRADLKAGTLRLESDVHGRFSPQVAAARTRRALAAAPRLLGAAAARAAPLRQPGDRRSRREPLDVDYRNNNARAARRRHHPVRRAHRSRRGATSPAGSTSRTASWTFSGDVRINGRSAAACSSDKAVVEFRNNLHLAATITGHAGASSSSSASDGTTARGHASTIVYESRSGTVQLRDERLALVRPQRDQRASSSSTTSAAARAGPAAGRRRAAGDGRIAHHDPAEARARQRRPVREAGARQDTMSVLRATHLAKSYKSRQVVRRPLRRSGERRDRRPARPERRRQDHRVLHDRGPGAAAMPARSRSTIATSRTWPCTSARALGHRLSAAGSLGVPQAVGRRQRPRDPRDARRSRRARARAAPRAAAGGAAHRRTCARAWACRCRAASAGASRSRARSPRSRASCCSTSPSRASIRSRSSTSSASSASSPPRASAC